MLSFRDLRFEVDVRWADILGFRLRNHHLLFLQQPLLGKDNSAHLQYTLKALSALDGVLLEAGDHDILNAILDFLPAAAKSSYPGALQELRLVIGKRSVDDLLLHADEVAPCQVLADHGHGLVLGVDIAGLEHEALIRGGAEDPLDPLGRGLFAGDEAFGPQNASGGVDLPRQRVDGNNMFRFVVPWPVLLPVGGGNLFPGVVEGDSVGEDLHVAKGKQRGV